MLITISNDQKLTRVIASTPYMAYECARILAGNVGGECLPLEFERPLVGMYNLLEELEHHEWNHLSDWSYSAAQELAQVAGLTLSVR